MAVKGAAVKDSAKADDKVASAPEEISLELTAHLRYVYRDTVFEKGVPFIAPAEYGKELLRQKTDAGQPVFVRFEGKAVKTVEVMKELRKVAAPSQSAGAPAATAVEIASPEELTELGLGPDGQETVNGEAGKGDDQAEVAV